VKRFINLLPQKRIGSNIGFPEPIMPNHAALVWISNRTGLQLFHGLKGALKFRLHFLDKFIGESDSADIDIQSKLFVLVQPIQISIPQGYRFRFQALLLQRYQIEHLRRSLPGNSIGPGSSHKPSSVHVAELCNLLRNPMTGQQRAFDRSTCPCSSSFAELETEWILRHHFFVSPLTGLDPATSVCLILTEV
ncbi:hypothetical protein KI387_036552, partial [Taxus chinensis]